MPRHPSGSSAPVGRRDALRLLVAGGAAAVGLLPAAAAALPLGCSGVRTVRHVPHPEPRPGITAERVLPPEDVPRSAQRAYDAAREIPEILDGLYCHCDCASRDGLRSLLGCFETRMPLSCGYCREEAELALKLRREGRSLAEIRRAVDAELGS